MPENASVASRPTPLAPAMQARIARAKEYVEVDLTGHVDIPQLLLLIRKLGLATEKHGDRKLLLDLTSLGGEPHIASQMQVGEQIAVCLGHLAQVASVVPTERLTRASEGVARARGLAMRVFDSKAEAIAWLRSDATAAEGRDSLDPARGAVWDAVRHLFPPHAQAIQLPSGTLAISWPIRSETGVKYEMAAPITVRLEAELADRLRLASAEERNRIAAHYEQAFREGLIGYDPYTAVPRARVIVLG